ncbi:MAG: YdcF family protein [Spirochaetaceae bacterium]|nr:YdcF family protein [Spirochaetaceae bacterium]
MKFKWKKISPAILGKCILLLWRILLLVFIVCFAASLCANIIVIASTAKYIYTDIEKLPKKQAVLVPGALVRGEILSRVLEDRVKTAVSVMKAGSAEKILLSGDHGRRNYDEVNGMKKYLLLREPWIPPEHIFLDHAGFNTYDSMFRAKKVFEVSSLIITTQQFHISRAVFIARSLGIDAVGYAVSQRTYSKALQSQWSIREYLARVKAVIDIMTRRNPRYLGPAIPVTGDGRASWD